MYAIYLNKFQCIYNSWTIAKIFLCSTIYSFNKSSIMLTLFLLLHETVSKKNCKSKKNGFLFLPSLPVDTGWILAASSEESVNPGLRWCVTLFMQCCLESCCSIAAKKKNSIAASNVVSPDLNLRKVGFENPILTSFKSLANQKVAEK